MAELAGGAARTPVQLAVRDDAAADAGAQGEHDHLARAAAGAVAKLGEAGHVGVVVDHDRHAVALAEQIAQGHVAQRQVGRQHDAAGAKVDHRRRADAERVDRAVLGHGLVEATVQVVEAGTGRLGGGGAARAGQDAEGIVDQPDGELGSAEIDTDDGTRRTHAGHHLPAPGHPTRARSGTRYHGVH